MTAQSLADARADAQDGVRRVDRPTCPHCDAPHRALYSGLRDRLYHAPGTWALAQCTNPACGLIWLHPGPDERDLGRIYERYFTHEASEPAWRSDNPAYQAWVKAGGAYRAAIARSMVGRLRRRAEFGYLDDLAPGRVLDVGCGDGSWLAHMRGLGWRAEGQETDAQAARYARDRHGLTVHEGELRALALPAASYDAVMLSHVIEHVYDPAGLLAACRRLLKPGGKLVALTPNAASFGHRTFGSSWVALDPPRHLQVFAPRTLAAAAERAGLPAFQVWTSPVRAQFIATASEDIRRTGRHDLHKAYSLPQLIAAMLFEQRAWAAYRRDATSGDELILEAHA